MNNKNISFNHTLEEYKKKYRNYKYKLLKHTKKEVEDFDKHSSSHKKNILLLDRKWWLIGDTYYEIPKAPRYTWFRNLSAGLQATICIIGVGVITTSISVPLAVLNNDEVIIPEKVEGANIEFEKKTEEGYVYKIAAKESTKKITNVESVYIGEDKLVEVEEYTVEIKEDTVELIIKESTFKKHKGSIKVNPKVEEKDYGLSLVSYPTDIGTILKGEGNYKPNTKVDISATNVEGYTFDGWYDNSTKLSNDLSYSYTTENIAKTLTAKFNAKTYNITYKDQGGVDFSGIHEKGYPTIHSYGTETTLKGSTKTGFTFAGWHKKQDCSDNPVVSLGAKDYLEDITLYALWNINSYTITATAKDGHGTITGARSYDYNTECTLTASAEAGYTFEGWYENDVKISDAGATYKFNVTSNRTLEARFTQDKYTVNISSNPSVGGTCSVSKGSDLVYNEEITLTATPASNYKFDGFYDGNKLVENGTVSPCTYKVIGTKNLTAKFSLNHEAFETCSWEYIKEACDKLENAKFSESAIAEFCSKFTIKKDGSDKSPTSLNDFVGAERVVKVNNYNHTVRIIGYNHDTITADKTKKAALTFEFKNLISDSNGYSLSYQWNDLTGTTQNYDYLNSTIRFALTGKGNNGNKQNSEVLAGVKGGTDFNNSYKNKTIISMLPQDLTAVIKTVDKTVGVGTSYSQLNETTYSDTIFMPSSLELGKKLNGDKGYGSTYKFYESSTTVSAASRLKVQANSIVSYDTTTVAQGSGQAYPAALNNHAGTPKYWTRSPLGGSSQLSTKAVYCYSDATDTGKLAVQFAPIDLIGIAPCFCI